MERSKAGMKKRSADSLSPPNQNTIIINKTYYFIRNGKGKMKFNYQKKWTSTIKK